ncbi:hypothetical protein [Nannocystis radixulma]|uniref:Serine/threonine protein kinase n=1 Tax=Nannocystis radixulma TaxID=2995305 RepID=A0ABT5AZ07_9BACT|nr:hypothetical protein [Nannocystis radixulma]MDC0667069.1 hypothetical protein [Nannocystis radixulma]
MASESDDDELLAAWRRGERVAKLAHPNIARVYEVDEFAGSSSS